MDKQANKVYNAENMVLFFFSDQIKYEKSLEFWRIYCKCLLNSEAFKKNFDLKHVHIFDILKGQDSQKIATSIKKGNRGFIFLSPDARYEITILHEICHLLSDDKDYHGSDYVNNMLFLVDLQMGFMMQSYLLRSYIFYNVNWDGKSEYADNTNIKHKFFDCETILENSLKWQSEKKQLNTIIKYFEDKYEEIGDMDKDTYEIYQILYSMVEETYCPICGSCGETLCCDPSNCTSVQEKYDGLYCEHNIKSYDEVLKENYRLEKELEKLKNESI